MRNLILGILVAAVAILGFFSYQSSQQGNALQAELAARTEAATAQEAEKATLTAEVARLQGLADDGAKSAADAAAAVADLTGKVTGLEADAAAMAAQVAALEAEKATLAGQVTALEAEKVALADQAAALQAQLDAMAAAAAVTPEAVTTP